MLETIINTLGGAAGIWWLAGGYFSMVIGERLFYLITQKNSYNDKDALCSIGLNLMNSVLNMIIGVFLPLVAFVWVYENARLFTVSNIGFAAVLAFVVHELAYYCEHRLSHRVGLLWAFHSIHHSSNEYNHTTAARGFFLDGMVRTPFELVGAFMGIPPIVYFGVSALKNLYGIWNHASYIGDLGPLERVLATPRNHKVHHANQPEYIDKNFGQVLVIWDRLLGTFARYEEPPVVGLVSQVHDTNPLTAQFAGFKQLWSKMKQTDDWGLRLAYLWKPPEWSHDGKCVSDCPKYAVKQAQAPIIS